MRVKLQGHVSLGCVAGISGRQWGRGCSVVVVGAEVYERDGVDRSGGSRKGAALPVLSNRLTCCK